MAERPLLHGYTTPPEAVSYASLLGCGHPTAPLHHPPWAGIADEEELRKLPQQQQPRLTSSSELPTYTVASQQPHDAEPEPLRGSFPASRQEIPSGLAKRLCVPPAQEFGHFTSFCHRHDGRRRENESRPHELRRDRVVHHFVILEFDVPSLLKFRQHFSMRQQGMFGDIVDCYP